MTAIAVLVFGAIVVEVSDTLLEIDGLSWSADRTFLLWQLTPFALVSLALAVRLVSITGGIAATAIAALGTVGALYLTGTASTAALILIVSPAVVSIGVGIVIAVAADTSADDG